MTNEKAQDWLDRKYPVNEACLRKSDKGNKNRTKEDINVLDIQQAKVDNGSKLLFGKLKLEGFANLKELNISSHDISSPRYW